MNCNDIIAAPGCQQWLWLLDKSAEQKLPSIHLFGSWIGIAQARSGYAGVAGYLPEDWTRLINHPVLWKNLIINAVSILA
jgi:hypothetical protein